MNLPLTIQLDAHELSVPRARRMAAAALSGRVRDDALADLQLIVSELVANGILHGSGEAVQLEISEGNGSIELTVTSTGPVDLEPVERWVMPASDQISGRGLAIVRSLADHVDVRRAPDSFSVTASRRC